MPRTPRPESIIAADIGSTLTHVCLIDLVEGVYRFVAHAESSTTIMAPDNDITLGLRRAMRQIERITQRRLLVDERPLTPEQLSGDGFDALVATSSAAPPLRCFVLGLTGDLSLESAERACLSSNATILRKLEVGSRQEHWDHDTLDMLRHDPPDVVVMTGGVDRGPTKTLETAAQVLTTIYKDIEPERRPTIIFAGNQEARRPIAKVVEEYFDYRVVDN
ncbi:MAG: glutamate mutase L, partial [Chloroflexi bacterium]|nr:glutamate mutase L [Chloroflexota bacterium]